MLSGKRLDRDEANRLWDLDLLALGAAADGVRRRLNPEPRVTYVIDRNINYTNVCVSGCRFCAFYRAPGADGGYVLAWDELAAKLQELKDHGGSGVLLQGGLNPELGPDYYEKLIGCIRDQRPGGARFFAAGGGLLGRAVEPDHRGGHPPAN